MVMNKKTSDVCRGAMNRAHLAVLDQGSGHDESRPYFI